MCDKVAAERADRQVNPESPDVYADSPHVKAQAPSMPAYLQWQLVG